MYNIRIRCYTIKIKDENMIRNIIKVKRYDKLRHERHGNCSKNETNKKRIEQPQTDGETTESIQNNWKAIIAGHVNYAYVNNKPVHIE